jgi:hypothetical protein
VLVDLTAPWRSPALTGTLISSTAPPSTSRISQQRFRQQILSRKNQDIENVIENPILAPAWFCKELKDGRPDSSTVTISPSITVSSGIAETGSTIAAYLPLKSLLLRERR